MRTRRAEAALLLALAGCTALLEADCGARSELPVSAEGPDATGACTPDCTGKACGASDGCNGMCSAGTCGSGLRCAAGACVCDATSCAGCCAAGQCTGCPSTAATALVLFGGVASYTGPAPNPNPDDTWTWDGTGWTEQNVKGPGARSNHAMATLNGTVVMFGGFGQAAGELGSGFGYLDDTWLWDGKSWTQQKVPGPSARDSLGMATLNDTVVLFGGFDGDSAVVNHTYLADTWTWDGTNWTVQSVVGPSARGYPLMATLNGRVVMYGGCNGHDCGNALTDTWTWDGTSWSQESIAGPPARDSGGIAGLGGVDVLFGGIGQNGSQLGDTWILNSMGWAQVTDPGGPSARYAFAMAGFNGTAVLFGGSLPYNATDVPFGDTWTWNGKSWKQANVTGPSPRSGAAMAAWP